MDTTRVPISKSVSNLCPSTTMEVSDAVAMMMIFGVGLLHPFGLFPGRAMPIQTAPD